MTNHVCIEGRIVHNAELKSAGDTTVTTFSIANDQSYKKNGEWKNNAYFFDCEIWGEYGNSMRQYLNKGQKLTVEGTLIQSRWTDNNGTNKSFIKIRVEKMSIQFEKKSESAPATDSKPAEEDPFSNTSITAENEKIPF